MSSSHALGMIPESKTTLKNFSYIGRNSSLVDFMYSSSAGALPFFKYLLHLLISAEVIFVFNILSIFSRFPVGGSPGCLQFGLYT